MWNTKTLQDEPYDAEEAFPKYESLKTYPESVKARGNETSGVRTDAITINGVLGRLSTQVQYQPNTPPTARARVKDGTLYIPANS
jgi:hypothetical protein